MNRSSVVAVVQRRLCKSLAQSRMDSKSTKKYYDKINSRHNTNSFARELAVTLSARVRGNDTVDRTATTTNVKITCSVRAPVCFSASVTLNVEPQHRAVRYSVTLYRVRRVAFLISFGVVCRNVCFSFGIYESG